ncbi:MAG: orotate phosphoribosyltransferase [Alphaproteobacteria bacterium]
MNDATADAVAGALLAADCFKVRVNPPFRLVSGLEAPFYIDCRQVLGHPQSRGIVIEHMVARARALAPFDVVAGGVTAGVPFATLIADRLDLPLAYVRGEAKAHGLGTQIEGAAVSGRRVLLVEDLVTTGDSSLKFSRILRDNEAAVDQTLVVLDRSLDHCANRFGNAHLVMHSLCTIDVLLRRAHADGRVDAAAMGEIRSFLHDPGAWSVRRAG